MKKNRKGGTGWYNEMGSKINRCRGLWLWALPKGEQTRAEIMGDFCRALYLFSQAGKVSFKDIEGNFSKTIAVYKGQSVGFSHGLLSGTPIKLLEASKQFAYMQGGDFFIVSVIGGVIALSDELPARSATYLLLKDCKFKFI